MEKSHSASYAAAGVNIEAGYEGVRLMKKHVARTMIPGVVSDIGGFGGLFTPDLSGMKTPTVSLVLGGGHSIGVPLAVSTDKSFITPSATMTIHPVRMNGLVLGVPQTLAYFQQMQERIVRFVSDNSGISPDRFREMMLATGELVMDVGTVLSGDAAVSEGLIDSLGSLSDALDCLYGMIENNAPKG